MCGVTGRLNLNDVAINPQLIRDMTGSLHHRGPDGMGIYCMGQVSLGHRRLEVIDLSKAARQPMHNTACVQAGRARPLVTVFNGEIYNFGDLRSELTAGGHQFQSRSDTEVILHRHHSKLR